MSKQNDLDSQLVYVMPAVNNRYDIFRYDFNSNTATNLTASIDTVIANFHPSCSLDGQQIAWSAQQGSNRQLWIMDADGQNAHHIAAKGDVEKPKWSPDGSKIAYTIANKVNLYDLKTGITTCLDHTSTFSYGFMWSSDSQTIAYITPTEDVIYLSIASIDNKTTQQIGKGDINDLIWAPNNTFYFTGVSSWQPLRFSVSSLSLNGQLKLLMPLDSVRHNFPTLSPDGERMAYFTYIPITYDEFANNPDLKASLHIVDIDGGNSKQIIPDAIPGQIRWACHQTKLAWGTSIARRIYTVDLVSRETRLIGERCSDAVWRP